MKKAVLFAALLASFASFAEAQAVKPSAAARIGHYVKTHKELLIDDGVVLAGQAADSITSTECQRLGCIETSPALGKHPSPGKTWGTEMSLGVGIVALYHLIWHESDGDYRRHLVTMVTVPDGGWSAGVVYGNVCAIQSAQGAERSAARARLAQ